jgi:hypothetical protein
LNVVSYPNSSAACKPPETTIPSTTVWRAWWRIEAERTGTDWRSLLDAAAAALSRFVSACPTCGDAPCRNPGFCKLCADADARKASRWQTPDIVRRDGAAASTIESLMLGFRERGVKALTESAVKRRLNELSEQQLHQICGRLQALKPHIARAWEPEEITVLLDAWNVCHA